MLSALVLNFRLLVCFYVPFVVVCLCI